VQDGKLSGVLRSLEPTRCFDFVFSADSRELGHLRSRHPRLVHGAIARRLDSDTTAGCGRSLKRAEALRIARQAERNAAANERYATLGRYMMEMKHSVKTTRLLHARERGTPLLSPDSSPRNLLAQIKPFTTCHCVSMKSCSDSHRWPPR